MCSLEDYRPSLLQNNIVWLDKHDPVNPGNDNIRAVVGQLNDGSIRKLLFIQTQI